MTNKRSRMTIHSTLRASYSRLFPPLDESEDHRVHRLSLSFLFRPISIERRARRELCSDLISSRPKSLLDQLIFSNYRGAITPASGANRANPSWIIQAEVPSASRNPDSRFLRQDPPTDADRRDTGGGCGVRSRLRPGNENERVENPPLSICIRDAARRTRADRGSVIKIGFSSILVRPSLKVFETLDVFVL